MRNINYYIILFLTLSTVNSVYAQNSPERFKPVQVILTPDHADWNYKLNEEATIKINIWQYGIPINSAEISYKFGDEIIGPFEKGSLSVNNGLAEINIGSKNTPGFKSLAIETKIEDKIYKQEVNVAFDPYNIKPTVKLPKDFDSFWEKALKENAKVAMESEITHKPEFSTDKVDVYMVNLKVNNNNRRIYGYMCKPKGEGKFPVLFCPPGAGVKGLNPYIGFAEQGFISFAIEIHGISLDIDTKSNEFQQYRKELKDYWSINMDDKNTYYYKDVYLGCYRSIEFLMTQPECDGKNVAVTGGSQGGGLAIVTAALHKKVTCVASFYPAFCDHTGFLNGRTGGWPKMFHPKNKDKTYYTNENINNTAYYDVVNFAKKITIPGFYSFGYNDHTCPPTSVFSAINSISAPKDVLITPITGHWRFEISNQKSIDWLKMKCEME